MTTTQMTRRNNALRKVADLDARMRRGAFLSEQDMIRRSNLTRLLRREFGIWK